MEHHPAKIIKLHDEEFEVDLNMIELITKLNETKLITRGCCENHEDMQGAYIIFENDSFNDLIKNTNILKFINNFCTKGNVRFGKYICPSDSKCMFDSKGMIIATPEMWITIRFPNALINEFAKIISS